MNGVLGALVAVAANTASADPLATTLSGAIPAVAGAAIGYLFGTMRDWSKTKAERTAKYRDQVLDATSQLLNIAAKIDAASSVALRAGLESRRRPKSRESKARSNEAWAEYQTVYDSAIPHELRISVLAPDLAPLVREVLETAGGTEPGAGLRANLESRKEHSDAKRALKDAVRDYLKIPNRKWAR